MTTSHQAILTAANAAISKRDFDGFLRHCTDDTTWHFLGDRVLKGKTAVRAWMEETYQEAPRFPVDRFIDDGSSLAALGEITLRDAKGRETTSAYCDVWRFEGDKLAELHAYVVELG